MRGKRRVEEWRGGLGEALRVAGPFVCRCPSAVGKVPKWGPMELVLFDQVAPLGVPSSVAA